MTMVSWMFIVLFAVCLIATALAVDYDQCKDKGWTPLYKIIWDSTVEAWHLFWEPVTSLYKKLRGL